MKDLMPTGTSALSLSILIAILFCFESLVFAQDQFQTYVVQPGDTCTSIARQFYGDPQAYNHIHEHNDLSLQGFACRPGDELKLPILPDTPEAKVMARAGDVRGKAPETSWQGIDVGDELFEAWRVNTLRESRAELGFRDATSLQMTENTLVVIYGPSKEAIRRSVAGRATVEKGRLKTSLAALAGGSLEVETPSAVASFESGDAQVTVEEDGESRIANHSGKAAKVASLDGKASVSVVPGQGTRARPGKPPEKPRPLPPTPTWTDDFSPLALTLGGRSGSAKAAWSKVDKAESYYVEVTRDRRQLEVMFSKKVPANITNLEMQGLPEGSYYVTVVAIDDQKFESIPSKTNELRIASVGIAPGHLMGEDAVLLGASLDAPGGFDCSVEGTESGLVVRRGGQETITCRSDKGSASLDFEVIKPTARFSTEKVVLKRGAMTSLEVIFDPALPPGATVRGEGLDVRALKTRPDAFRVNLATAADAEPGARSVEVAFEGEELASLEVEVVDASTSRELTAAESTYFATVLLGYDAVGVDPYWSGFPDAGASVELGIGAMPLEYFASEFRAGFSFHSGDESAQTLALRAQAMFGLFDLFAAPYLGFGLSYLNRFENDDRFAGRAALGFMPPITESLRFRAEVAVDATPQRGTLFYLPEIRLGLSLLF